MTPKKPKASAKVKPVKAWAVVGPKGKIVCFDKNRLCAEADSTWELGIPGGFEAMKERGYRCIRVVVTPV